MKLCVLGSGSRGNCTYVGTSTTHILIDAGLSGRETARRLDMIGVDLASVSAVCVSHEHDDHQSALAVLHRRHGVALYANAGTIEAVERDVRRRGLAWQVFSNGAAFTIGDIAVEPFSVPHDAYDPVGFILSADGRRVAVVTDIGAPTELIRQRLRHCRALVVEANHDTELLRDADRPWTLKQRIAGRQGHLSNLQAAELLRDVADRELQTVFLAHLSEACNRPDRALAFVQTALAAAGQDHVAVHLTFPDRVSHVFDA